MALAYAVSDLSLKDVAAWASTLKVAEMTGPGLFYRLREAESWLERVLAQTLEDEIRKAPTGMSLRAWERRFKLPPSPPVFIPPSGS